MTSTASGLTPSDARAQLNVRGSALAELCRAASIVRTDHFGARLTYSPKAFLPVTNLCRNRCDYCSFRRSAGDAGEWTMSPADVTETLDSARESGCIEALLCLGDTPETAFPSYRKQLGQYGASTTVDYLDWVSRAALDRGLLPHTNAGLLSREDMLRLRATNVSLGLMLESVSERLCEPGMPHYRAPDKRPKRRIAMLEAAGQLRIPFTTGLLIGIGETRMERLDTLLCIADLHARYGHIQEVIVQNFTDRPEIAMHGSPEPLDEEMAHTVAMARLILTPDVSVQSPPNLNPERLKLLVDAGINDFGGISPLTRDYINPRHPWPHLETLARTCAGLGFDLQPRLPIYERFINDKEFMDASLMPSVRNALARQQPVSQSKEAS